jgi:hypothetical protein
MTTTRVPTEHEEQRAFVWWWRSHHPGVRIFAIPNGGGRSIREGGRLKAEGVTAGVPDLCIPAHRVWVEMKRLKGGRVDPAQKEWADYLRGIGHHVVIAKGCADAIEQVTAIVTKEQP